MIPEDWSTRKSKQKINLQSDSRPYLNGPTYNSPTYESQVKCFSPRNASRFLNKSGVNQLQMALTRRPKNRAWACLHQLSTRKTRIAAMHETTLLAVQIKPTKAVTSLSVNIKPTRSTTSSSRAHQEVYRVFQNLQKRYGSPGRLVATVSELLELFLQE